MATAPAPVEPAAALTRAEIERRAAEAIRASGLRGVVNPVVLCRQIGVRVQTAEFVDDELVGMIAKHGGEATVSVSAAAPPLRKRFAIAHELGHYFLHLPGDGEFVDREVDLFRTDDGSGVVTPAHRREVEANLFAVALLMPERAVRARWGRLGSVTRMARRFQVSEEAIGLRVAQLGLS